MGDRGADRAGQRMLVTGAAGFVGRALVPHLLARGVEVLGAGRGPARDLRVDEYYQGDLARGDTLAQIRPPVDAVIHLAAAAHGCASPDCLIDNTYLVYTLARQALDWGTQRIVFLSSSAVYRPGEAAAPVAEDHPLGPTTLYGLTKLLAEVTLQAQPIPALILRATYLYGPGDHDSTLVRLIRAICAGETPQVRDEPRDYLHVADAVDGILGALDYAGRERVFNLGTGQAHPLPEIARRLLALRRASGGAPAAEVTIVGQGSSVALDCARAARAWGWHPRCDLIDQLPELLAAYARDRNHEE